MKDFLGNELQPGDFIVINKNTQTGSSTSRKILYKTKVERLTKLQVVTENFGYICPDNVIKIPANKEIDPSHKACNYCDIKNYQCNQLTLDAGEYTGLVMKYKDNKFYLTAYGDDQAFKEIDYCPFCGRSLNEGGEK